MNTRLHWLLVPLPALLLGLGYAVLSALPTHAAVIRQGDALRTAQTSAPADATIGAVEDAVAALKRTRNGLTHKPDTSGGRPAPSSSTVRLAEQTSQLLARHRLRLIEDGSASATMPLPPALSDMGGASRLRTHRVQGAYLDVLAACDELATTTLPVVPVRLTMTRHADGYLEWTVITWR